ncbi:efflux transporter outer membrane subunit [Ramlibacter tataouinensis]|uniref:efflux transporter outer membrane subunit n=1 Tax=Ramlibacter tataouinensis TaxID=94132 RepID=UPI0022F3D760|nr:efflux transporter outer membrane subunit [Ramlibacter tataouinensis]WBY01486.1 efflux transporter outer membrane subunit [Ramlibacter tataouinensis]
MKLPDWRAGPLLAAALLAGCASPAGIQSQAQRRSPASVGLAADTAAPAPAVAPGWWRAFGDPQLDRLVEQALADSPTLKIAQARTARAQAVLEVAGAATRPQLQGSATVQRQRYTETGAVPPPLAGSVRDSGTLQLGASWEIDFFGRYREALAAALGSSRAAEVEVEAARVLLASQVARSYFQLARIDAQLQVAQRTLAQREQALGLVRERFDAGLDTTLELRQSEGALPDARQQIEALQEQAQLTRHALAALVAQPDAAVQPPALASMRALAIPAAIPADLLARRADIMAARWRIEAATHDVASARAQFYPNVNLGAFVGLSSIGLSNLLEGGSLQWGVGPALQLPIFDAGRLRANLRGKAADLDLAIESYNGAILDAVREVADQLASARSIGRQQMQQREAQGAAEAAYGIAVQRYQAGLGTYLQVLSAETAVLDQRRLAVDLAARALDNQVQLMRSLGGGFQPEAGPPRLAAKAP